MWRVADEALEKADFSTEGRFVACFSEVEDDLAQWRGYGGGECGYAIGFRFDGLLEAVATTRPDALLVPMNYQSASHTFVVNDLLRMAQIYFRQGLQRGIADIESWAKEFLQAFAWEMDLLAIVIKHPKFSGEVYRRWY